MNNYFIQFMAYSQEFTQWVDYGITITVKEDQVLEDVIKEKLGKFNMYIKSINKI